MQKVFEHVIDLSEHAADGLTVEKLWAGIEDFALHPHDYVDSMQESRVEGCSSDDERRRFSRELDFGGSLVVCDVVELEPPVRLTTLVSASGPIPESRLDITVHCEENGALALRFCYFETPVEGEGMPHMMQELRKKAWLAKDQRVVAQLIEALKD